jgi:uncharacterized protein YndB with AHSA1/START domain
MAISAGLYHQATRMLPMNTTTITNDTIEKTIEIKAPVSRVWRALTDSQQFGEWFRVKIDGPFALGKSSTGQILVPGFEHIKWSSVIQKVEPERVFAYTWNPYAADPARDYTLEEPTLVEFTLEPTASGTRLTVVESGFSKLPASRRDEAFRMNTGGWVAQLENIARYVEQKA